MGWKDDAYPEDLVTYPLCVFCSETHTREELLNWQIQHLRDIDSRYFPLLLRNVYRFFESEVQELKNQIYDLEHHDE